MYFVLLIQYKEHELNTFNYLKLPDINQSEFDCLYIIGLH